MKSVKVLSALGVMSLASTAALAAEGPDLATVLYSSGFNVSGAGAASLRQGISDRKNAVQVDQILLAMTYQSEDGFGGGVDLATGEDVNAQLGGNVAAGNNGNAVSFTQAYMRYKSGAYTVTAGRFYTAAGYEVFPVTGNLFVSRSQTFGQESTYHTGVRGTYALNDKLTLNAGVNNGVFVKQDNQSSVSKGKTAEVGASWVPSTDLSLAVTYYRSGEQNDLLSLVTSYNLASDMNLALNLDKITGSTSAPGNPPAFNAALYLTYTLTDKIKAGLRLEELNPTGSKDNTGVVTVALAYAVDKYIDVRAELSDSDKQGPGNPRNIAGALQTVFKF